MERENPLLDKDDVRNKQITAKSNLKMRSS